MDDRQHMRASDADRQEVVDRLRDALAEGRLKMDEYDERMGLAYEAVTYGDLAALSADLPQAGPPARPEAAPPAPGRQAAVARPGVIADLPAALKVLWTIWLAAVAINLIVWVLVSATTGDLIYPWPVWVAGPSGAALLAVSAGVTAIRRGRRSAAHHPPGDAEPHAVAEPADLARALDADPAARAAYDRLSYSRKREHVLAIESAKKPETRARRIDKALAMLRDQQPAGGRTARAKTRGEHP
jgi:DUF1707 SHOCT-like domain/Bacteriocin-protection, YdeI or OmpD-Associated